MLLALLILFPLFFDSSSSSSVSLNTYVQVTVDSTTWDGILKTGTETAKSTFHCASLCLGDPDCSGFFFESSSCETSTRIHLFRLIPDGDKTVHMVKDVLGQPGISKLMTKTGEDTGDSAATSTDFLYVKICLSGGSPCCETTGLNDQGGPDLNVGSLNTYDGTVGDGAAPCIGFIVPDFRTSEVKILKTGPSEWRGLYLDVFFQSNGWRVRCVNPAGGKIVITSGETALSCSQHFE